ncbi:MAG: methylmalonyl-CoA carboxyltransferase [Bacteroidales bacterium]|nr:methylmalonyl-CoA carboxyltransferase [Clostridium sp.]MCM1202881.1 methylmalonyl-CoA carboxyltransferase [Bacteroidales bacterium]
MYLEQVNPYSIAKQHGRDKLHILERIRLLFDSGSFTERYPDESSDRGYDGVITGYGQICGQRVYFYGQDFTHMGGTFGEQHSRQIIALIKEAMREKRPVIGLYDGGGARIQEGAASVAGCGELFRMNATASGYIPQIAIIAGTCAGGAVYSPGLTDFIFTIEKISNMFVTGAKVINEVQGTDYLIEELGGAEMHSSISGVAHFCMPDERSCYAQVRKLVDMLPPCCGKERYFRTDSYHEKDISDIRTLIPADKQQVYDVVPVIEEILDDDSFLEVQRDFAKNIVVGFGRLGGVTVGVVASQTICKNGSVDCDAADKAARMVQYCDCYNIPIITLADSTGFVMEAEQEYKGLIRHGAKMVQAYANATTIRLTVILRKAYGGPYIFMGSKQLGADRHYVWPDAEVAVMKAEGAVAVTSHSRLMKLEGVEKEEFLQQQLAEYKKLYMNSDMVLNRHFVDGEILPEKTREILYQDIIRLSGVPEPEPVAKKHANMPV